MSPSALVYAITGALVGVVITLAAVLLVVLNPFDTGSSQTVSAAAVIPIAANGALTAPQASSGGVPGLVTFQGVLTDSGGSPISDGARDVTFSVHDAASGGTQLWSETQSVATNSGLFTALLGSATAFPADLFAATPRYLEVQVESDPPLSPRQQFTSVPYAAHAATAAALAPPFVEFIHTFAQNQPIPGGAGTGFLSAFLDTSGCRKIEVFFDFGGNADSYEMTIYESTNGSNLLPLAKLGPNASPQYDNAKVSWGSTTIANQIAIRVRQPAGGGGTLVEGVLHCVSD